MLKKGKNRKNWAAWLLTAALAGAAIICGIGGMTAAADDDTQPTQDTGSLTVQMPPGASAELDKESIEVKLYRVADIDWSSGFGYEAADGFADMEQGLDSLVAGEDDMTALAAVWDAQAEAAYEIIGKAADGSGIVYTSLTLTKSGSVYEGTLNDLKVGLYLMVVESLYNANLTAQYTFIPTLISLPLPTKGSDGDVSLDYDLTVSLKCRRNPLYGDLIITKYLTNSVSEYLPVSFVFHVTAVEEDGVTPLKDEDGNIVYDNYVHAEFIAGGKKRILIEGLPAGALVKVEEVYTGASYELAEESRKSQTVLIVAEEFAGKEGYSEIAAAEFFNEYGGGETGGYGITNHYEYVQGEDGIWHWEIKRTSDSSWSQAGDNTPDSGITNEVWHKTEDTGADEGGSPSVSGDDASGGDTSGGE